MAQIVRHPFQTSAADHCETPYEAYADIAPVLKCLATLMGKDCAQLRIYECVCSAEASGDAQKQRGGCCCAPVVC